MGIDPNLPQGKFLFYLVTNRETLLIQEKGL